MSSKENATQPVDIESEVSKILLQIGVPAYIRDRDIFETLSF